MWKDGEETHLLTGKDNVVYNYKGNVYCYCPKTETRREMTSGGFEKDTPINRASYKWEKEYNKRTAVERVNSRFDVSFGFELHTIRGLTKMKVRCGPARCVMLAMALGRVKENQADKMRSLVSAV